MSDPILDMIKKEIEDHKIVLFTKGTAETPMCGFSARAIAVFRELGVPFKTVDILPDPRIRQALSSHSNWPTIPQVFIGGKFVGGADIIVEMYQSGELQPLVTRALKA